jgi:hypothetical protein
MCQNPVVFQPRAGPILQQKLSFPSVGDNEVEAAADSHSLRNGWVLCVYQQGRRMADVASPQIGSWII